MDLIDRAAVLTRLRELRDECIDASKTYGDKDPMDEDDLEICAEAYEDAITVVENAPSAVPITTGGQSNDRA
jgi:hypothetical protein